MQTDLKRTLREMVRNGQILKDGKRFRLVGRRAEATEPSETGPRKGRKGSAPAKPASAELEGILHVHRDGFGFVHPLSGEGENVFLPPAEAARALDNDRVVITVGGRVGRLDG